MSGSMQVNMTAGSYKNSTYDLGPFTFEITILDLASLKPSRKVCITWHSVP